MPRGTEQAIKELVHEIRTPLAALALLGEGLDEASRVAHRETVALIESLLHTAGGQVRPGHPTPVDTAVLAAVRMVAAVKPAAVVRITGGSSILVPREALEQILLNVLLNAVRHSPSGSPIQIAVFTLDGELRIEITDQGCGVSPEDRDHIFAEGYSTASSTGLGLGIARRLAGELGGRLALADCETGCRAVLALPTS